MPKKIDVDEEELLWMYGAGATQREMASLEGKPKKPTKKGKTRHR